MQVLFFCRNFAELFGLKPRRHENIESLTIEYESSTRENTEPLVRAVKKKFGSVNFGS